MQANILPFVNIKLFFCVSIVTEFDNLTSLFHTDIIPSDNWRDKIYPNLQYDYVIFDLTLSCVIIPHVSE